MLYESRICDARDLAPINQNNHRFRVSILILASFLHSAKSKNFSYYCSHRKKKIVRRPRGQKAVPRAIPQRVTFLIKHRRQPTVAITTSLDSPPALSSSPIHQEFRSHRKLEVSSQITSRRLTTRLPSVVVVALLVVIIVVDTSESPSKGKSPLR